MTIKSRERTLACVRHGELLRNAHASFLIAGSEPDEIIWAGSYHKCDQRRLRRAYAFCAISSGSRCSLTQSFEVDED